MPVPLNGDPICAITLLLPLPEDLVALAEIQSLIYSRGLKQMSKVSRTTFTIAEEFKVC